MTKITLLINCDDQSGIIAAVTNFIANNKGNIVYIDQHVDREQNIFFMRLESEFNQFDMTTFKVNFKSVLADKFKMKWRIYDTEDLPNMAVFVSKYDHCLYDILGRYNSGELHVNIPFIISNHNTLKPIADSFNIPFYHIPVTKDTKEEAEAKQLELLEKQTSCATTG